tara:strand:- start:216 stop:695 length:480 start_codon:yes stop_codon:yes gene_type:complete
MEKIPFTQAGLDKTKSELHQLKNVERQQVIRAIADAREHGDLSENAEYHAARERQSFIEGRIKELEDVTSRGEVIDASRITGKTVTFGVTVVIVDELTDVEYSYSIVGPYEAELEKRKISTASPIAKGLIGKQVGDSVEVQTPRGPHPYEILSISVLQW